MVSEGPGRPQDTTWAITDTANFEKFKVQHSRGHSLTQTSTQDFLSGSARQLYLGLLREWGERGRQQAGSDAKSGGSQGVLVEDSRVPLWR